MCLFCTTAGDTSQTKCPKTNNIMCQLEFHVVHLYVDGDVYHRKTLSRPFLFLLFPPSSLEAEEKEEEYHRTTK